MVDAQRRSAPEERAFSLLHAALCSPDDIGLVFEGQEYSFHELSELAELERRLLDSEWDGTSPVALFCSPSLRALLFLVVCLEKKAPLLLVHPRWSLSLRQEIEDQVRPIFTLENGQVKRRQSSGEGSPHLIPSTQVLIGTSGSSGTPRIVQLSAAALLASARASESNLPWVTGDRWLLSLPFAHVGGLSIVLRCLNARKTIVWEDLSPKDETFSRQLDARGITLLSLVPTQLQNWLNSSHSFPTKLRAILVGGSALNPRLHKECLERGLPVLCTYGMTEVASQIATQRKAKGAELSGEAEQISSCGRPLPGIELRVDPDDRLFVRGPQLMLGYLGENPQNSFEDGWFRTGDRAKIRTDGEVMLLGRMDHVIISGGENVSPEWVENTLFPLAGVAEFCILGVPDPHWGEVMVVAVVLTPGGNDDMAFENLLTKWRQRSTELLPDYARPKRFILLPELPLSPGGKIDRRSVLRAVQLTRA